MHNLILDIYDKNINFFLKNKDKKNFRLYYKFYNKFIQNN